MSSKSEKICIPVSVKQDQITIEFHFLPLNLKQYLLGYYSSKNLSVSGKLARAVSGLLGKIFLFLVITPRCYWWVNGNVAARVFENKNKNWFGQSMYSYHWHRHNCDQGYNKGHSKVNRKAPRNSLLSPAFQTNYSWLL